MINIHADAQTSASVLIALLVVIGGGVAWCLTNCLHDHSAALKDARGQMRLRLLDRLRPVVQEYVGQWLAPAVADATKNSDELAVLIKKIRLLPGDPDFVAYDIRQQMSVQIAESIMTLSHEIQLANIALVEAQVIKAISAEDGAADILGHMNSIERSASVVRASSRVAIISLGVSWITILLLLLWLPVSYRCPPLEQGLFCVVIGGLLVGGYLLVRVVRHMMSFNELCQEWTSTPDDLTEAREG